LTDLARANTANDQMALFDLAVGEITQLIEEDNSNTLEKLGGVAGIAKRLHTSLDKGLPDPDPNHDERLNFYGVNKIPPKAAKTFAELMWDAVQDETLILLIISAIVSLVLGLTFDDPSTGWIEGAAILTSVCIVVFVTAGNDYAKERQFMRLNAQVEDFSVAVIRGGERKTVSIYSLVVGDILELSVGDILPVDGILIEGYDIKIDESCMTGESDFIKKTTEKPFLLSGTKVMEGSGKYLSVAVGKNSQAGIIKSLISSGDSEEHKSVLQTKLEILAKQIGYAGTVIAAICVVVLYVRFFYEWYTSGRDWDSEYYTDLLGFFITGITILVVAVPEGLPLAVTLSLAFSVQKMQKDNNLVKHLDACETMGSATTICSDKTGTLTTNRMTVMRSWVGGQIFARQLKQGDLSDQFLEIFASSIAINSNARVVLEKNGTYSHIGNKTECALLQMISQLNFDYEHSRQNTSVQCLYPFSSARKRMTTIVQLPNGKFRLFTKGASEIVLGLCSSQLNLDGRFSALRKDDYAKLETSVIEAFAEEGLRTLCMAYKDFDDVPDFENAEALEQQLVCLGIVGIEDPVRDEVPKAIIQCRQAGITVRMVTGDNLVTARSIAKKCGLIHDGDDSLLIEGPDFRARVLKPDGTINQDVFDELYPKLRVMARSSPTDKYTLVTGLLETKLADKPVVAVTGDGTNDAPALKKADVGFAMGIAGTSVAKDACDIILLDDNFNSIVKAVKWGRNVYDSIGKFLQFQLTVNVVAITVALIGAFVLEESPLTAVQMLWVNLIMDSFASLALATEPPTDELLKRKPYGRQKPLISRIMWLNILGHATYQLVIVVTMIFYGDVIFGIPSGRGLPEGSPPTQHYTMVFCTFVLLQIFNEINSRKLHGEWNVFKGIFSNMIFVGIWFLTVIVQVLLVQYGGLPVRCTALSFDQWLICVILGAGELLWHFVIRSTQRFVLPVVPVTNVSSSKLPQLHEKNLRIAASEVLYQQRVINHMKKLNQNRAEQPAPLRLSFRDTVRVMTQGGKK